MLIHIIHKFIDEYGGYRILAALNSVEIYRNRIYLGGRQPENERKSCIRSMDWVFYW